MSVSGKSGARAMSNPPKPHPTSANSTFFNARAVFDGPGPASSEFPGGEKYLG